MNKGASGTRSDRASFWVRDLSVSYFRDGQTYPALKGVSVEFVRGEVTAVVGASGGGKTTLARALLGGIGPGASVAVGDVLLPDRIAYVQQEPHASLHPTVKVGVQVADVLAARLGVRPRSVRAKVLDMFTSIGLRPAPAYFERYAHSLSGGEAQRVALARALALDAELLIADEPTSQLDLISQAQAVKLIDRLTRQRGASTLLVTHDLALVAELADRVVVLENGSVVESGPVAHVWRAPRHPCTSRMLNALKNDPIGIGEIGEATPR